MNGSLKIFLSILLLAPAFAVQGQVLASGTAKGGGTFSGCDTSLTVELTVTPLGGLSQQFEAIVDPGNTIVGATTWTYFTDELQQTSGETIQVTYPFAGEAPVCLTVAAFDLTVSQPCSTTTCRFIDMLPDPSCIQFQPDFTIGSINGNTISFEPSGFFADSAVSMIWHLGDGTSLTNSPASHTYSDPGPHEVCLTVTGPEPINCTATVCKWLYLGPGEVACSQVLEPGFMYFISENIVVVIDTSIVTGQNSHISWDFGDGTTAEGPVAVHVYDEEWNQYPLCAQVDVWGPLVNDTCENMFCEYIMIGEAAISIEEYDGTSLELYPNPADDHIRSTGFGAGPVEVSITDGLGRLVHVRTYAAQNGSISIPLHHLERGVYTIRCSQGSISRTGRFVKA